MPRLLVPAALALASVLLSGCMGHEQKMIQKVDRFMAQEKYGQALDYLEGYLGKHSKSLAGWRYRVLIRLEQEDRAMAAGEYAALNAALERHEPDVLREVVLGAGGRWLISDYRSLARCAPEGVADAAFFGDILEPKHLGAGSLTKVAVSSDEIAAVIAALPGSLPPGETWPLVQGFASHPDPKVRARVVRAAGRHLATNELSVPATGAALEILRAAALGDFQEAALLASLDLPPGPGRGDFVAGLVTALAVGGDGTGATSLFLLGPDGEGPTWTAAQLEPWAETAEGPLRVLAVSGLVAQAPTRSRSRFIAEQDASEHAWRRLAAVAGFAREGAPTPEALWSELSAEDRRTWGPALSRSAAFDRGTWATLGLTDSDAVVAQQTARALALPGVGDDPDVDAALEAGMKVMDPATRAYSARAAVVRGAESLSLAVQGLFAQGQDRVMTEVLQGLVDNGGDAWQALVAQGLRADLPMIREQAVDAAVASCRAQDRKLMTDLLVDNDPHVAVRAASALYVLVGAPKTK